jgi:enamine deaminase RidA (YjgF/YER057c/UK114 family)
MQQEIMPPGLPAPPARYAHAVLVTGADRWLHTAGIGGIGADGAVADTVAGQARTIWDSIGQILAEAGMTHADVVSVTTYVVAGAMGATPGAGAVDSAKGGNADQTNKMAPNAGATSGGPAR